MAQQTAVEWLVKQLKERGYAGQFPPHLLFEQAKQMEKKQIVNAWRNGDNDSAYSPKELDQLAEQYYTDTYNTKTHTP